MNNSAGIQLIEKQNAADNLNRDFELSHIIGLNTNLNFCVQCHPAMNESIIYSVGGIVIAEDLSEKNNQVFFRHGKNQISSYKLSNTGKFLAVGFTSGFQNLDKKMPVSIILWDYENKEIIYELTGITKAVTLLEFSQDDKFLAAAGADNYFYIWEVETGYKCFSRIYEVPTTLIYWTTISFPQNNHSMPNYTLTLASVNGMNYMHFFFELKAMQYNMANSKFTLPSTGFIRNFTCGIYDYTINGLYLGTAGGELVLFAVDNLIFKSSFNVINNGVNAMVIIHDDNQGTCLIVGGGDGRVKKVIREDDKNNMTTMKHMIVNEIQLEGKITSLSLLPDNKEVICSTSQGFIYRILISDLTFTIHSIAHNASVNDVCFNTGISDRCFVSDDNGNTYLWDLNDFIIVSSNYGESSANCLFIGDDETLFIGYGSGLVKNYSISQDNKFIKLWEIPAHRGHVNTIYVDGNYILTGGEDGIVRVWTRKTHEMIIQFSAHHKDVFNVFADINKPNLIYSCGADRSLNTFDIKLQKRVNLHNVKNGIICGISQKQDADYEIISCGHNSNLNIWDFFQSDPVAEINLNEKFYCIKISNNGKFFAMGSDNGEIWIFKLPEFDFIGKSTGHSLKVKSLKWSPDDKQIISVSSDSSVCIWNFYKILN